VFYLLDKLDKAEGWTYGYTVVASPSPKFSCRQASRGSRLLAVLSIGDAWSLARRPREVTP